MRANVLTGEHRNLGDLLYEESWQKWAEKTGLVPQQRKITTYINKWLPEKTEFDPETD